MISPALAIHLQSVFPAGAGSSRMKMAGIASSYQHLLAFGDARAYGPFTQNKSSCYHHLMEQQHRFYLGRKHFVSDDVKEGQGKTAFTVAAARCSMSWNTRGT